MSNITTTPQALFNPAKYDTTQEFYSTKGKKFKTPAQIGKRKETELEDLKWTDKVFTGDNPHATAFLVEQVRDRHQSFNVESMKRKGQDADNKKPSSSKPASKGYSTHLKRREEMNADADQETQLVHLKNTSTSEGKIDLSKVQDIIRALRRRYQSRSNVQSLFKDWDESGKGFVDSVDIQHMLDKMGLKVNQNEANMLLVCIDENGDNRVTANEFLDLVFTHNDGLMNIDTTKNGGLIDGSSSAVFDEIKKNAERVKKLKPMNQWKLFLQKNLNNIALDLLAVDSDRKYSVDYKDFMKVIDRRAKIPEYLKQENSDLLYEFIGEYTQEEKVDYRSLVEDLRYFNYEEANENKAGGSPGNTGGFKDRTGYSTETRKRKTIFEDDYIVLDSQKVPPNILDKIEIRLAKVSRFLKRSFGSEKALDKALKEAVSAEDKNGNLSVDDLKHFVLNSCKD